MDKIAEASLLYDFYGELLTTRQREVMALYHEENLSLTEIGQEFGISRQAVYDTLKKAEQALREYEDKLKLIDRFLATDRAVAQVETTLRTLEKALQAKTVQGEEVVFSRAEIIAMTRQIEEIRTRIGDLQEA